MRNFENAVEITKFIEALISHDNYSFYYFELSRIYDKTIGDIHFHQCFNTLLKSEFLVPFASYFIVNVDMNFNAPSHKRLKQEFWSESKIIAEEKFKNLNLN